ncbi:hypothetical protein TPHA_0D04690 [Tetrapisispora phaffii CBS 4417]|uniref:Suppressor of lethality of KEX2 GAS1 double null mutant protein 1 n=1 Tax=Tetrapisispora phaffii (strain ATCC 24235 / CBS 4417 / NBRC 1672 / NRRL Y-8282 / UCD 70-5) TaxID=1071381 RepID=G8BS27_TETPH|nr:hypothetical protein TPHA_0D04690 [Tetrapisispora phaffii CBS 4417]CCE63102.1 hypothetical protein TPHA_0D04690 [Tetrapisispora phaffii CBS 4417]
MLDNGSAVAVGCAVGIPVGVGCAIGLFFWLRFQKRLKREESEDLDLQKAIYDDEGFISFNNLSSMQYKNDDKFNSNDEITQSYNNSTTSLNTDTKEKRKSKHFVPAYRRKINSISRRSRLDDPSILYENNGSKTSIVQQPSLYEQMIPVIQDDNLFFNNNDNNNNDNSNNNNANNNTNINTDQTRSLDLNSNHHRANGILANEKVNTPYASNLLNFFKTDSSISVIESIDGSNTNNDTKHSTQLELVNKLQNGGSDLATFYPRRLSSPSTTNNGAFGTSYIQTNNSQNSIHTRSSSMNSFIKPAPIDNIFSTPTKSVKSVTNQDNYQLKNNYDIENANEIEEEDQYENDYTNYSKNRSDFIDSLRPKNT